MAINFLKIVLFLVKTWNGEKSFVDREVEHDINNGIKRSFDDEYNEDFDRGVVSILIINNIILDYFIKSTCVLILQ